MQIAQNASDKICLMRLESYTAGNFFQREFFSGILMNSLFHEFDNIYKGNAVVDNTLYDVYVSDEAEEKFQILVNGGIASLHVITDFDHTLSSYKNKTTNQKNPSTHSLLLQTPRIPSKHVERSNAIYDKFYPIEVDPKLSHNEKLPFMRQWTLENNKSIVDLKLDKKTLDTICREVPIILREGIKELCDICNKHSLPILIFSAGIGDIVKKVLDLNSFACNSMHLVSNMMIFDDKDVCVGFNEELLVDAYSKNEVKLQNTPFASIISNRKNVLLIGDSLGDSKMSECLEGHNVVFKVGFLNNGHDDKERLLKYRQAYDIVITNDSSLNLIVNLLNSLLKK